MPAQKPPLRLMYEPDVYLCTWSVPDGKGGTALLPGSVELRPNRPPRGTVHGALPLQHDTSEVGVVSTSFPQFVEMPVLYGTLANGGSVVLLDAWLTLWDRQGEIYGTAALLGKGAVFFAPKPHPPESSSAPPLVTGVTFQIAGLDSVLGASPIKGTSAPWMNASNPKDVWSATFNSESRGEWVSQGLSLSVGYDGNMRSMDSYEVPFGIQPRGIAHVEPRRLPQDRGG